MIRQRLAAGEVVDHDLATLAVGLAPVDDALAESATLRLDVAVAGAVGGEESTVVDVLRSRLLDDLGILPVERSVRQNTHLVSQSLAFSNDLNNNNINTMVCKYPIPCTVIRGMLTMKL